MMYPYERLEAAAAADHRALQAAYERSLIPPDSLFAGQDLQEDPPCTRCSGWCAFCWTTRLCDGYRDECPPEVTQ